MRGRSEVGREERNLRGPEFLDRYEGGRELASLLRYHAHRPDTRVLALPRGGVPVAYVVARMLGAPLDVFLVRKLGAPRHEELGMGAIASGGMPHPDALQPLGLHARSLDPGGCGGGPRTR